jgi:transaldolase
MDLIRTIVTILFKVHGIDTEIIFASIRNPMHVTEAAVTGSHIATVPLKIIKQMIRHPFTVAIMTTI